MSPFVFRSTGFRRFDANNTLCQAAGESVCFHRTRQELGWSLRAQGDSMIFMAAGCIKNAKWCFEPCKKRGEK